MGVTNSTKEAQDLLKSNGNTELEFYAHSRGGMTVGNTLKALDKQGVYGIAGNTNIQSYGPAFDAQSMAILDKLSDGKQTYVVLDGHTDDFVSR
ncbi:hypothetical protein [Bartonella koehlerae]|uniref:hypothetical protein n=1 Tax=Bartonella koehlerae TaxID=92181 RepID=UPI001ABB852E|nr:hypothetical protein [Bartonella koehlerae]